MTKKILLLTLMLISALTSKAATLSETIDSLFKPIVDNYLVPVIFWDPIKAIGFDVGASVPIVVVWLVFGAIYFTFIYKTNSSFCTSFIPINTKNFI